MVMETTVVLNNFPKIVVVALFVISVKNDLDILYLLPWLLNFMIKADSMILLPLKPELSKIISPKPLFSLLP